MRRTLGAVVALATAAALSTTLTPSPGSASPGLDRTDKPHSVKYALRAAGFGSRLYGGQLPAGSHQTAFTAISCTVKPGVTHRNHEAEATLPGAGAITGVKTRLWTRKRDGAVHSYSRNTIAKVVLAQSGLGKLQIRAITSLSHAWHDAQGFHAATATNVGSLEFVPPTGDPQVFDLPTPDQPIEIPGLATISIGNSTKRANANGGVAEADVLQVVLQPSHTRLTIGHSSAQVLDGVQHGTFHGYSAATKVSAVDDHVTSGRTPLALMPCQGTNGKVRTKAIADVNLGDQIIVQGVRAQQMGKQLAHRSKAFERGTVAELNLGDGALVVSAVVGQANVLRKASGKLKTNANGTTIGRITANGEPQSFPDTGVLEIPGVAKLEPNIVKRTSSGIKVTALRITLLDGTGAVVDLGVAQAFIRRHK